MTDRELLECAAKAAGLGHCWFDDFNDGYVVYHADIDCNCSWNPLESDGDALRLGAKVGMKIYMNKEYCLAEIISGSEEPAIMVKELCQDDTMAAARLAIVRAVAATVQE